MTPPPADPQSIRRTAVEDLAPDLRRTLADIVFSTTNEGIWLIDALSITTFVNRHTAAFLGYAPQEMIGKHLYFFMDDEGRAISARNVERRKSGIEEQHEFKFQRKDGGEIWTLLATNPLYDQTGAYAGALAMVRDITYLKRASAELEQRVLERTQKLELANQRLLEVSVRDGLTGLFNSRYAHDRLEQEVARAIRGHSRLSVMFIDVDQFKAFNDTHGHLRGDEILRTLGRLLASDPAVTGETPVLRRADVVARYGGEEFLIICPDTPLSGAVTVATRLCEAIARFPFAGGASQPTGRLTVSIGVAELAPSIAFNKDDLLKAADTALYAAKASGRNRVEAARVRVP